MQIDFPKIFQKVPGLLAVQSTRIGGISKGNFSTLNLGFSSGDDEELVTKNRNLFFQQLQISESEIASSFQTHGDQIFITSESCRENGYDAIVTNQSNLFTCVTVADCVPVLVADPVNKVVAAIHAGWRGTALGIVEKTIRQMEAKFGSETKNCLAYIGTCISQDSFEVGKEVAEKFEEDCVKRGLENFFVDLKKANRRQLERTGFLLKNIEVSPFCTALHNERYFSYRKEKGLTGRMLALIGFRE